MAAGGVRAGGEGGFTLVEVVLSLVIVATAMISLLTALGGATENVIETVRRRKMRYLMQIIMADVELGKISPLEEEERYEEGSTDTFADWSSEDAPEEYANYEYTVRTLSDVPIVGGGTEEEMAEAGFDIAGDGTNLGRTVSNDFFGGAEDPPPGQYKRLLVLTVKCLEEDADEDSEFAVMTYLPFPGEEDQQLGGGDGPGGPGGLPGAEGAEPAAEGAPRGGRDGDDR